jgi:hypothetical protein
MTDGVKLAYARDKTTGRFVHVSQDVGTRELICPDWDELVNNKAGKTPVDLWKVLLIEEDFHRLMFEMEGT